VIPGSRPVTLADIPSCLEGIIPSSICTVGADGWPNVTYLSVVQRVDDEHVLLSRQFFNKTERNTDENPHAQVNLTEPETGRLFQLDVTYVRTEREGELFEQLKTKLDAVAAFEGMENIFELRGADVCHVDRSVMLPSEVEEGGHRRSVDMAKMQALSTTVASAADMEDLFRITLDACVNLLGCNHAFIMLVDESGERLYTVASIGYPASGAGSEVRFGEGVIGLVAQRKHSVRFTQLARDLTYSHAARDAAAAQAGGARVERAIALPQLPSIQSQVVTPMLAHRRLVGVLCLQSELPGAFQAIDECVVGILASQVAMAMTALRSFEPVAAEARVQPQAAPAQVKHYAEDGSVFIDNEYLIKGVAGDILWRLLRNYQSEQRVEFSNKEIRLDSSLDLPDIKDNLEARLILLRKRLEERCDFIRIEKVARGRFRLVVTRPLTLQQAQGGAPA